MRSHMGTSSFTDLLEEDFRWPAIGDKLFSAEHPTYGAFLSRHTEERLYHLTGGYKLASDLLVEQAEAQAWRRRKLVYPIVFCYRHYLELTLKSVLQQYGPLGDLTSSWTHHRLEDLWRDYRKLLGAVGGETSEDQGTGAVEQCVAEFAKIDSTSDAFRYPTRRRGQPFSTELEMLDLISLRDTMQGIENYFLAVEGFLDSLTEVGSLIPEVDSP